jgi:hypothetical protein
VPARCSTSWARRRRASWSRVTWTSTRSPSWSRPPQTPSGSGRRS